VDLLRTLAFHGGNEWRGSGGVGVDDLFNVTSVLDDRNLCDEKLTEEAHFTVQ